MDLVEMGWGDVDWIGLAQDRDRWRALVNSVLNLRVPSNAGKLSSVLTTRDLWSSVQLQGVNMGSNLHALASPPTRRNIIAEGPKRRAYNHYSSPPRTGRHTT
jgi:hypothetical protein